MIVEKEATLRAAERELYPEDMAGKRVRKAKCLDFGEEDTTSTGNKASGSGNPKQVITQQRLIYQIRDHLCIGLSMIKY